MSIFDFLNYKDYLVAALELRSKTKRGQKLDLAKALAIHPGYLSKVLGGINDLSLEQAEAANRFFGHTEFEARFFLVLVSLARAGTVELRAYFQTEIDRILAERSLLSKRVQSNRELNESDQARYYSTWYIAAVHVAVSVPTIESAEQLAEALLIPATTVNEALEFLVEVGLLIRDGNWYKQGEVSLFLSKKSNFLKQHHLNWRTKSIQSLDISAAEDFHYTGVITCSKADIPKIREVMLKSVAEIRQMVSASGDDTSLAYTLDLFRHLS